MKIKVLSLALLFCLAIAACKKSDSTDDKPGNPNNPNPTDTIPREKVIEISTTYGSMYIWLYKLTPQHRSNFLKLAGEDFFDSTTFHRIVPGFVIQGGDPNSKDSDPNNDGQGGPGYTVPAEITDSLKNIRGSLAAARLADNVNPQRASSGSQFYVNMVNNTSLDNKYTVFGFVMKGMNVADSIVKQPRDGNDRPLTDIRMRVNILEKTLAEIKTEYNYTPTK